MHISNLNKRDKITALFILIGLVLILAFTLRFFFLRASLNSGNVVVHSSGNNAPVITANNGSLNYNSVSVKVPEDGASYVIGYDWAKDDKEYPSIPSSASAFYTNEDGQPIYEILLYRDKISRKNDSEESPSLDKWFDEWIPISIEGSEQTSYKTPKTSGILVRTINDSTESGDEKNCSYTYYFAVEASSTIEQYVLELNFFDSDSVNKAESLFQSCAGSISVKKPASQ